MKSYLRGAIHCHSRYSFDCVTPIASYLRQARKLKLDFVILTDHDTVRGSAALQAAAAVRLPHLQVPIAAEYCTDQGDVIAVFLSSEIAERKFEPFVSAARSQGALLLLPHPYVGHKEPEKLGSQCDLIEVFNSRASRTANASAENLAQRLRKPTYAGADSHFARSLRKALIAVEDLGDLRTSLLQGEIRMLSSQPTSAWETGASQLIKAWKTKDVKLAYSKLKGAVRRMARYVTMKH
jgi:predicted metal-dependent phosphoesterase TrpH